MVSAAKAGGDFSLLRKASRLDQSEGLKTHVYRFSTEQHGNDNVSGFTCADQGNPNLLETIILSQWDNFAWKGPMDYDVTACELKVIEGGRNFVVQRNDKRNPFYIKENVKLFETFGCLKPNCTGYEALLLCVAQGEKERPEVVPSTSPPKDGLLLIANAYPIEYGHIFLVPSAINQLSCSWDKRMFGLAAKIACEVNNAAFRVFFDIGASVMSDCMIFQACYYANHLPVESASTVTVYDGKAKSGITVSEITDYPLKTIVFSSNNIKALVKLVSEILFSLHDDTAAYSVLISSNGTKVFLFPQVKNAVTGCSLSAWECGGYFVYHKKLDFDRVSETEISNRMASVSLQDSAFEDLKHICCAVADLVL